MKNEQELSLKDKLIIAAMVFPVIVEYALIIFIVVSRPWTP